jgi:hypothetical protein
MRLPVAILLAAMAVAQTVEDLTAQLTLTNPYVVSDTAWGKLPAGRSWGSISAIDAAPDGRSVWVADRCGRGSCNGQDSVAMIFHFDLEGRLLHNFGAGQIAMPHGLTVDPEGNVWVADAAWLGARTTGVGHVVRKFSSSGQLLMTLGKWGEFGPGTDTFDRPSDILVAPNGDIFVADGHDADGNDRIIKFDRNGKFLKEWGKAGSEAGEFRPGRKAPRHLDAVRQPERDFYR